MIQKIIYSALFCFFILLTSCRKDDSAITNSLQRAATPLIPGFADRLGNLRSIIIKNNEKVIEVVSEDSVWYLKQPYKAEASGVFLNQALSELIQAAQGQSVTLEEEDYDSLLLNASSEKNGGMSGIEITLRYDDSAEPFKMILGSFHLEKDSEEARIFGGLSVARRYVRHVNEDKVYITSSPLNSFEPNPSLWESTEFPKIHRLQSLSVTEKDGFSWSASKTSSYSAITLSAPFQSVKSPLLIKVFKSLLSSGYHEGVISGLDGVAKMSEAEPLYTIHAKDRFGGNYVLEVIGNLNKDMKNPSQNNLAKGMISLNASTDDSPNYKICRLKIDIQNPDEKQKRLMESLKNREIRFNSGIFDIIESFTNQLKKNHEKN